MRSLAICLLLILGIASTTLFLVGYGRGRDVSLDGVAVLFTAVYFPVPAVILGWIVHREGKPLYAYGAAIACVIYVLEVYCMANDLAKRALLQMGFVFAIMLQFQNWGLTVIALLWRWPRLAR